MFNTYHLVMKNNLQCFFSILLFHFIINSAAGQQAGPIKGIQVKYMPLTGNSQFKAEVKITLIDSSDIADILVKMGSTRKDSDILNKTFVYDQAGTFSDGTSYSRAKNIITVGLGTFPRLDHFFGEVYIQRSDGSLSDPISFSR